MVLTFLFDIYSKRPGIVGVGAHSNTLMMNRQDSGWVGGLTILNVHSALFFASEHIRTWLFPFLAKTVKNKPQIMASGVFCFSKSGLRSPVDSKNSKFARRMGKHRK